MLSTLKGEHPSRFSLWFRMNEIEKIIFKVGKPELLNECNVVFIVVNIVVVMEKPVTKPEALTEDWFGLVGWFLNVLVNY